MSLLQVNFPNIGTFNLNDFWHPIYRPLNLLPQSPELIDTRFMLYTRHNQLDAITIKQGNNANQTTTIKSSHFDGNKPTKFIIHGFLDNTYLGKWMTKLKDELIRREDCNVFLVDWMNGNSFPYTLATANTRVVGPVIALFINELKKISGLHASNVHLIGHSLGAHIAGYAGQQLNGTVGRITGLDPAGPYFDGINDPNVKLDPTDAQFVDAIHTNAKPLIPMFGFGMYETSGHLDFYPNGGVTQPGCIIQKFTSIITDGMLDQARKLCACDHLRAIDYYLASMSYPGIKPVGHQCSDYDAYRSGKCQSCGSNGDNCAIMGVDAIQLAKHKSQTQGKRYFLTTGADYPYFNKS
ncbi:pancreatic triacylglycerol lipase-like [Oppia nitens]|uniref:pancreatic triacylglycerol lipase-like n=1 Tax=Oppia nitens TaxID=1686743 RepID=UPI0023DC5AAF|nr:pancreatic triacylglycerol lipase-like [Oppia nitens]